MLARDIWRETARQTPLDNVIDAQMVRLRRKVDGQFDRKLLHTVRGVGFMLARRRAKPDAAAAHASPYASDTLVRGRAGGAAGARVGGTCALLFWQLRSQLDHFAVQEIETVEGLFYFTPDGQLHMREDYHNHPESKDVIERYLEVLSPDGTVLLRNERLGTGHWRPSSRAKASADTRSGPRACPMARRVRLVSRVHCSKGAAC